MKESVFQFSRPVVKNVEYNVLEQYEKSKETNLHRHFHRNIVKIENTNDAIVELTIQLGCDEKSINPPFSLMLTIGAKFSWDNSLDEEIVNNLLTKNAPSLLLGYARPIISNITSNSVGQYDLPSMSFIDER